MLVPFKPEVLSPSKCKRIRKYTYKTEEFLKFSWVGWHLQSINGNLVCWFFFLKNNVFIISKREYYLFFLKEFSHGSQWTLSFPPRGLMCFQGQCSQAHAISSGDQAVSHIQVSSHCAASSSCVLESSVVLVSVGFITWMGTLNETCYTTLEPRVHMESEQQGWDSNRTRTPSEWHFN